MIQPGEVRGVRQLGRGVQAQVCLGADVKHGSAIITIESKSPEVIAALELLHDALRKEAKEFVGAVLDGQRDWDKVMTRER
jgi:stage III sporulation protein SpoIIIAA